MLRKDLHEENRLAWNEATRAHNSHKGDQAAFFRSGGSTLFPEEVALLGDLAGRSLVHLQCNAGQDTLSLARLGATVTGVDISDEAIAFATRLAHAAGIAATFVRSDLFDWFVQAAQQGLRFDVAFSSYGAICWISDISAWARGVAQVLAPGGRFVLVDFHPFAMAFNERWQHTYDYFTQGRAETWEEGISDYVATAGSALAPWGYEEGIVGFCNPHRSHEFRWGIGELVTALIEAGLQIEALREYPFSNGAKLFEHMREQPGRRMIPPEGVPNLPLMFGVAARKPEQ